MLCCFNMFFPLLYLFDKHGEGFAKIFAFILRLTFSYCSFARKENLHDMNLEIHVQYVRICGFVRGMAQPKFRFGEFFRDCARRSKKDKKNKRVKANGSGAKVRKAAWHPIFSGVNNARCSKCAFLQAPVHIFDGHTGCNFFVFHRFRLREIDQKCHAFCENACNTAISCFCQLGPKCLRVRVYIFFFDLHVSNGQDSSHFTRGWSSTK